MGKDWSQCQGEGGKDEDVPALELSPGAWEGIMSERVLLRMCRESVSCLLNDSYYSAHLGAATCAILHPVVVGTLKKKIMDLGNKSIPGVETRGFLRREAPEVWT